jgi:hypothetical protein
VSTEAILFLSICRRYARLDIFAFGKFDMFSLRKNIEKSMLFDQSAKGAGEKLPFLFCVVLPK